MKCMSKTFSRSLARIIVYLEEEEEKGKTIDCTL